MDLHALADDRFQEFKDGLLWLRERVMAAGAKVIHGRRRSLTRGEGGIPAMARHWTDTRFGCCVNARRVGTWWICTGRWPGFWLGVGNNHPVSFWLATACTQMKRGTGLWPSKS